MSKPLPVETSRALTLLRVLWPSFIAACLLEGLVFGLVDPGDLSGQGTLFQPSRQGVYSLAFFIFWMVSAACCGLALWLARPVHGIGAPD
ncbi:MAG: hypothetical protein EOO28_25875 [Comamonadaceae bacterium]|nr:MAG: hypothetical protein EOO28_25875 [Comamonadaceae bacterium]